MNLNHLLTKNNTSRNLYLIFMILSSSLLFFEYKELKDKTYLALFWLVFIFFVPLSIFYFMEKVRDKYHVINKEKIDKLFTDLDEFYGNLSNNLNHEFIYRNYPQKSIDNIINNKYDSYEELSVVSQVAVCFYYFGIISFLVFACLN